MYRLIVHVIIHIYIYIYCTCNFFAATVLLMLSQRNVYSVKIRPSNHCSKVMRYVYYSGKSTCSGT